VEFIANFMTTELDPLAWAKRREGQGWHVLGCADHFWSGARPFPHVWVTLGAMAASTSRCLLTSSFSNNLFRSPVEFAFAAAQMQHVSGGRFEAGLGAGWSKDEADLTGIGYPSAGVRAARYREAVTIAATLLREGMCSFSGEHYQVDVPVFGPRTSPPPPLIASLGGDRTIREIAPLVDRVELKLISAATRNGTLDTAAMAAIPASHLGELVAKVRAVNTTVPLGVFILCSVGDDPMTKGFSAALGDSFLGGFFGSATKVADSMRALAEFGITRIQVSPFSEASFDLLAAELFD
jgi:alkanesulfonate monooxygenase SsuD/methylene tetrahydromethanopterin reductase-like flavin-dependent oxidoreductase (luciferase family)